LTSSTLRRLVPPLSPLTHEVLISLSVERLFRGVHWILINKSNYRLWFDSEMCTATFIRFSGSAAVVMGYGVLRNSEGNSVDNEINKISRAKRVGDIKTVTSIALSPTGRNLINLIRRLWFYCHRSLVRTGLQQWTHFVRWGCRRSSSPHSLTKLVGLTES
jgi:hypothetical protein